MITTLQISSIQLFHNQLTSMFVCAFVDSYILVCFPVLMILQAESGAGRRISGGARSLSGRAAALQRGH